MSIQREGGGRRRSRKKGRKARDFFHNYNCHPIRIVNKIRLGQMYSLRWCCVLRTRAILKLINCVFLLHVSKSSQKIWEMRRWKFHIQIRFLLITILGCFNSIYLISQSICENYTHLCSFRNFMPCISLSACRVIFILKF